MIRMSQEAHAYFLQKVVLVDSLEKVVVTLEVQVKNLQDSMERAQKDFVGMLIASDKIKSQLEQARYALGLQVADLERQVRLLKISRRQRKALLRKYYPKLTRQQRVALLFGLVCMTGLGLIIGLTY